MLRSILLMMLAGLSACAPAASTPPEMRFALADPNKYKTETERARALDLAQTACKAKALVASAELEKTIAAERHSLANVDRAHEKAAEMYTTSYNLCMLSSGYVKSN
ncbi:MAG: hypothetical protein WCD20_15575 [Rhodomicrobium sp.]